MLLTFPIQFYPAIQVIERRLYKPEDSSLMPYRRRIFRSVICTAIMLVAFSVPKVGLLVSLFGALGCNTLAVILPPLMYLSIMEKEAKIVKAFHISISIIGVAGLVTGTASALSDIFR